MPEPPAWRHASASHVPYSAESVGSLDSFAVFVDRALLDMRQVLVAEHVRLLRQNANEWSIMPESRLEKPKSPRPANHQDSSAQPSTKKAAQDALEPNSAVLEFPASPPASPKSPLGRAARPHSHSSSSHLRSASSGSLKPESNITQTSSTKSLGAKQQFFDNLESTEAMRALKKQANVLSGNSLQRITRRILIRMKKEPLEMVDAVMGVVILANAIAIGVSSDTRDWKTGWLVIDSIFAVIFIAEFVVKAYILGCAGYLFGRSFYLAWFELALIALSLLEIAASIMDDTFNLRGVSVLRVVRLLRLTKLLRLGRVPMADELVMMVNGLVGGARTLFWAILLTMFPLSIFCLVMRETLGEESGLEGFGAESFDTLPKAGFNTFRCLVVEDCADDTGRPIFVLVTDEFGWFYGFFYSLTLVFMKFGLYNVIIAIFVEQTVQAAKYNEIYQKRTRLNDQSMFHEKSLEMAELAYSLKKGMELEQVACHLSPDEISSLELSNDEFNNLCKHEDFKDLLSALDVNEEDHLDLFDTLDVDGGGTLDLGEIISGISKLRGDARKSDIVAVILLSKHLSRSLTEFKDETATTLRLHQHELQSIQEFLKNHFRLCQAMV